MTRSQLIRFLFIATTGAWLVLGVAIRCDAVNGHSPWLLAAMWMPALAALTSSRASRQLAWRALARFRLSHALLGLGLGTVLPILHDVVLWVTGTAVWNRERFPLAPDGHGLAAVHARLLFGSGPQSFGMFAVNLMASLLVGSIVGGVIAALGEELGWRAVLQPDSVRRFGALRGTLFVGVIWAYWHLPINLAGYNDPVHPVLTSLVLFPLGVVAMSFALGWLSWRTASVWPAAFMHGANNAWTGALGVVATGWAADNLASLIAALVIGLVFGVLLRRAEREPAAAGVTRSC